MIDEFERSHVNHFRDIDQGGKGEINIGALALKPSQPTMAKSAWSERQGQYEK
jgi:hypothetical protein